MPRTITVDVHREGRWWVSSIPAADAVTQSATWRDVRGDALGVAAAMLDIPTQRLRIGAVRRTSSSTFTAAN